MPLMVNSVEKCVLDKHQVREWVGELVSGEGGRGRERQTEREGDRQREREGGRE